MTITTIERIPTGLTRNYVGYWTIRGAIKEAAQNIAYGVTKSGLPMNLSYEGDFARMEDQHTGFEKRHLYIGESEQRDDKDGLGTFGEGWKVFLLVMAREGRMHEVQTVGFTFWGEMVPTPHGTEILEIVVAPNDRTVGTSVVCQCDEADFRGACDSFAVLAGIGQESISVDSIIPDRFGELWINGVRIEQGDNTNPLNLHYAYNLKDRTLVNRDRSQVNVQQAMGHIRNILTRQDSDFIREFVELAMEGNTCDDIQKGPYFVERSTASRWVETIADVHKKPVEKLVLTSNNPDIDKDADYRGYTLVRTPQTWAQELSWAHIKPAQDVVKLKSKYSEVKPSNAQQANLNAAKRNAKKALGLTSVKDLPPILVVDELNDGYGSHDYNAIWDADQATIYVKAEALWDDAETTRCVIHECIHWQTGEGDNQPGFTRGFETAILRLLGLKK